MLADLRKMNGSKFYRDVVGVRGGHHLPGVNNRLFLLRMFRVFEDSLGLKKVEFLYVFTFGDLALCNLQFCLACRSISVELIFSSVFMYIDCMLRIIKMMKMNLMRSISVPYLFLSFYFFPLPFSSYFRYYPSSFLVSPCFCLSGQ